MCGTWRQVLVWGVLVEWYLKGSLEILRFCSFWLCSKNWGGHPKEDHPAGFKRCRALLLKDWSTSRHWLGNYMTSGGVRKKESVPRKKKKETIIVMVTIHWKNAHLQTVSSLSGISDTHPSSCKISKRCSIATYTYTPHSLDLTHKVFSTYFKSFNFHIS